MVYKYFFLGTYQTYYLQDSEVKNHGGVDLESDVWGTLDIDTTKEC